MPMFPFFLFSSLAEEIERGDVMCLESRRIGFVCRQVQIDGVGEIWNFCEREAFDLKHYCAWLVQALDGGSCLQSCTILRVQLQLDGFRFEAKRFRLSRCFPFVAGRYSQRLLRQHRLCGSSGCGRLNARWIRRVVIAVAKLL